MGSDTKELMVYEKIKSDLLAHEFAPGFQMVERTLSEKYNVSRSPVRCALRLLVKDGLLKSDGAGRIMVPDYTVEDILEIYDMIEIIQDYSVKIFMKQPENTVAAQLEDILDLMKKSNEEGDLKKRMDFDDAFHFCIVNSTNNSRLIKEFECFMNQKKMFDFNSFEDADHAKATTNQHEEIFTAIREKDADKAILKIKEHEQYIKKYYIEMLVLNKHNV